MIELFHKCRGSTEEWLYLDEQEGKVIYMQELDGPAALRYGTRPRQEEMTWRQAVKRWPEIEYKGETVI